MHKKRSSHRASGAAQCNSLGTRKRIDRNRLNQHLASLNVLLMTLVLPVALFDGVAQTSRSGLEENESFSL